MADKKSIWIAELVTAGFTLLPYLENEKFVRQQNWQHTAYNPNLTAKDIPGNYGVVLSDDVVVVDVDPRNFQDGVDSFSVLMADLGINDPSVLDTFQVRTGGGGLHWYFRKNPEILLKKSVYRGVREHRKAVYPGIEILSRGHQVVGPGSIHPVSGKMYTVAKGDPFRLLPAPIRLYEIFKREKTLPSTDTDYDDSPENQQRFVDWLRNVARPAIQHQEGDRLTLSTALYGRGQALSEPVVYSLMSAHWNPFCQPPWAEHELARKVRNAYLYGQQAVGADYAPRLFKPVEEEEHITPELQREMAFKEHIFVKSGLQWDFKCSKKSDSTFRPVGWRDTLVNALNFFRWPDTEEYKNPLASLVRLNTFADRIEFLRAAPWHKEGEHNRVWDDNADCIGFQEYVNGYLSSWPTMPGMERWCPPKVLIRSAILRIAVEKAYNPVEDYFKNLQWDGVPRLSKLFGHYTGAENSIYMSTISRCFLIGIVARACWRYDPKNPEELGCKQDHVVILEGEQGTGKSSFCRVIGGRWYKEIQHLDPHKENETIMQIQGGLLCELSEMMHTKQAHVEWVKAFISRTVDTARFSYDARPADRPRRGVFIVTLNPGADLSYLSDQTGNRRYWPVVTNRILLDELARDRDQLFAEAYEAYLAGEPWHIVDDEAAAEAKRLQAERTARESWADRIEAWAASDRNFDGGYTRDFITTEILGIPVRLQNRLVHVRVANAMKDLGWHRTKIGSTTGYRVSTVVNRAPLHRLLDEV